MVEAARVAQGQQIWSRVRETGPLRLALEQQVVHRPEPVLPGGAHRDPRGGDRVRVRAREREIDEDEPDFARLHVLALERRQRVQGEIATVGALEVGHLVDRDGRVAPALGAGREGVRGGLAVAVCNRGQGARDHKHAPKPEVGH